MVLTVDIGNSSITVGLFRENEEKQDGELLCKSKYSTDTRKSADEYAALIYNTFTINSIRTEDIDAVILASVVPQLTQVIREALSKIVSARIYLLGPGLKTGLNIRTDDPSQLGADIVADAVGALSITDAPCVIIDVGTATSVFAIDKNRAIIGGAIAPGVRVSLDSLKNSTSQLPSVSLSAPKGVLGKNTDDAMRSGLIYGHAFMIDGMINALADEMGKAQITAVITGGLAHTLLPCLKNKVIYSEDLTLLGLYKIYQNNSRKLSV